MMKICILREAMDASCHCQEDNFKGEGFTYLEYGEFVHITDKKKLILIHAFCKHSTENEHKGCGYVNYPHKVFSYCRLAPQVKITGVLYLNDEAKKRVSLQKINEPYYIVLDSKDNEKLIYSSIAKKCNVDSIDISSLTTVNILINATCQLCGLKDCAIYDIETMLNSI